MARLSVVLPIFNVEEYLEAALASLACQTHRDLEVVMVDDGSTDGSPAIAERYAAEDGRFRLVRQENHGLGHARNTGLRHVTGDFVTFVDSDDIVPHYAFRMAIRTLEETGSDFLSGNEYRFDYRGAHPAPMLEANFSRTVLRTNVSKQPSLMRDLLPHNKIYRRSFWDAAGLEFPEGILFEDGPVSVKAHALAKSVDVVSTPIYYWRLREGGNRSLSQLSDDQRFFVDRIQASAITADFLEVHRRDLLDDFFSWDIRHKFPVMYKALPRAPRPVQERFMAAAVPHLRRTPEGVIASLPPGLRLRVEVTKRDDLGALLAVLPKPAEATPAPSAEPSVLHMARTVLGRSHALRTVRSYVRTVPASAEVKSSVMDLHRDGDKIRLSGYAYVAGLPADGPVTARNRILWVRHLESRKLVRLRLRAQPSPEATAVARDASWEYRGAGFDATLPLRQLKDAAGNWQYGTWVPALGVVTARGVARGGLRLGPEAYRSDPAPVELGGGARLVPTVINGVLNLRLERSDATLSECRLEGQRLVLTGRVGGDRPGEASLALGRVLGVPELSVKVEWRSGAAGAADFQATVELSDVVAAVTPVAPTPVAGHPDRLYASLAAHRAWPHPHQIVCDPGFAGTTAVVAGHRLVVHATTDGCLAITVRPHGPMVEAADWTTAGELRLGGTGADQVRQMQLVGRHSGYKEQRVIPCTITPEGSWEARFNPERVHRAGAATALRAGLWRFVLRTTDADGRLIDTDLPYDPRIFAGTSQFRIPFGDRYWLKRIGLDSVALRINSRLRGDERGPYNGKRLRETVYPQTRKRAALRETVLYDSFNGKQYSDSPRAVHEELCARNAELEHIWVTRDAQAPVPEGIQTVEANSREWFQALATSRYVVANTHLPPWFRRRDGQVVAQTWHGIGFKRVAFDMDTVHFANKTYLTRLEQEAPNWSFLVSPSSFCTEIMRRAFRYDGEICEIGSPRNDVLITDDRAVLGDRVRRELGLTADRKILLYAPTWRDNEYYGPGRYKFTMHLDVGQFPEEMRREYALLVRRHPNTVDDLLGYDSDFVYDVANYPDARDLLAAADVLISDYSTIALDFVNTGRPILFFTYDLEHYRDELRGFYFDLEGEGPGPVLQTSAEVLSALTDLDAVSREYRSRYDRFRQVFCHAEDGNATARLVDRLLRET